MIVQPSMMNKIAHLKAWNATNTALVRADDDALTFRQAGVLVTVYVEDNTYTIRSLAKHLRVNKAAVVRAIDTLSKRGLVTRVPDPSDARSVLIGRTAKGISFVSDFAAVIMQDPA